MLFVGAWAQDHIKAKKIKNKKAEEKKKQNLKSMNGVQTIALTLKRREIQFDVNKGAQNLLDF